MKKELFNVTPDFNELESECPKTSSIHLMLGEKSELTSLESEFHFPENKEGQTPFYILSKLEKEHLANVSESVYGAMIASLDILLHPDNRKYIEKFFSPEFVKCYPEFIDYAIYTYQNKHKAISGRFDFAYDFSSGCVTGVYESNMDSPVTYYDSVVLQHHLCKRLGNPEHQWNEHHESLINAIPSIISGQDKRIAFLCDVQSTEDSISTETLFHAFNEEGSHIAIFDMLSALEFDFTDLRKPCFSIRDAVIDAIYSLYPWEYMVEDFYNQGNNPLLNWKAWADSTRFIEPAWRYFLSNKGMFAWLTFIHEELSHESEDAKRFMMNHKNAFKYILPSYVDKPTGDGEWIKKPLLGRQSANVSHIKNGTEVALTDGDFVNSGWLYQKYMQTGSADSGNTKAIVCTWMCPDNKARSLEMEMKGISVREFNDALPTYETERFVPHLMLEK